MSEIIFPTSGIRPNLDLSDDEGVVNAYFDEGQRHDNYLELEVRYRDPEWQWVYPPSGKSGAYCCLTQHQTLLVVRPVTTSTEEVGYNWMELHIRGNAMKDVAGTETEYEHLGFPSPDWAKMFVDEQCPDIEWQRLYPPIVTENDRAALNDPTLYIGLSNEGDAFMVRRDGNTEYYLDTVNLDRPSIEFVVARNKTELSPSLENASFLAFAQHVHRLMDELTGISRN